MKRLFLLFSFSALHGAGVEGAFYFEPGYRCDYLHWTVHSEPGIGEVTEEKWKHLQIVDLAGRMEFTVANHFYVRAEGDYGWILGGTKTYDLDDVGSMSENEWLNASPRGYVYDVTAGIGYLAGFFSNQFQMTPLVGYSYSVQHMKDSNYVDKIHLLNLFEDVTSFSTYQWIGPWLGLCLAYLHKCFRTSFEYQFHFSSYRGWIQDNLVDSDEERQHKTWTYGNEFTLRVFSPEWRRYAVGLVLNYQFYNGSNGSSVLDGRRSTLSGVHWNSGSILLSVVRSF